MSRIRRYRTFEEARLDLYKEMWKKGFVKEEISEYLEKMKNSLEEKKIIKHPIYPPGIYPFRSFEEAERDLKRRIKKAKRKKF